MNPREYPPENLTQPHTDNEAFDTSSDTESATDANHQTKPKKDITPLNAVFLCPLECSGTQAITDLETATQHLREEHALIIDNVDQVVHFFNAYVVDVARRIQDKSVKLVVSGGRNGGGQSLRIVGSAADARDAELRTRLKASILEEVLRVQQDERERDTKRKCLFCRVVPDNRTSLLEHMWHQHNLNIGVADNIVYFDEFLNILEGKLTSLQCLYCEKTFKGQTVLRLHMRKKKHFKLRPCCEYDRFYIVNYTESRWGQENGGGADEDDENWDDWNEPESLQTMCLFCEHVEDTPLLLCQHLLARHGFDLLEHRKKLDVYQNLSLVNYLRKQFIILKCFSCLQPFQSVDDLEKHLDDEKHTVPLPPHSLYSDAQNFFPTVDGDPLLMFLGEGENEHADEDNTTDDTHVLAEPVHKVPDLRNMSIEERLDWISTR
ncbi:hypothetical protein SmJEL517_g05990 [Synchytrium microbalum]|uniref:C2H2-type domain-containing protein n=1 Tax=Synchytrium microbalum TaxID=1806994 RepID=A0A507BXD3_9FUNG|nr:uncharacterized protein SmJEL517_g05990 [Synchytrium microbalum]TPX30444.1 hypothetical protein SmJEL517_g05990 [Synchytrium microbalum]